MDYKTATVESYNTHAVFLSEKFKKLMDLNRRSEFQQFADLIPGKKIVDLGCGSGDHAAHFASLGLDVTAIDISQSMIDLCVAKGLNASVMDIEDLQFDDASFDGIWAVTSLLHIPKANIAPVIEKLYDLLRDDGILYICLKEGTGEEFIIDPNDPSTKRFFSFWSEEELLKATKQFELLNFKRVSLGESTFLQLFLKK